MFLYLAALYELVVRSLLRSLCWCSAEGEHIVALLTRTFRGLTMSRFAPGIPHIGGCVGGERDAHVRFAQGLVDKEEGKGL